MVIRRIREHVATHNWFAVSVDLAIVVAGVFLGTEATSWNEDRAERADAADYRSQIIDNLKANESDLISRLAYYKQVQRHAVAALNAIEAPDAALGEPFLIDSYQASQGWFRGLERSAYDELVDSGLSRKLGDPSLRAKVSGYYVGARTFDINAVSTAPYRDRVRRYLLSSIQEQIRAKCGDIITRSPYGIEMARLPDNCVLGLDPALAAAAAKRLSATPELREDLTRQIADLDQKIGNFHRRLKQAHDLRVDLEAS